MRKAILAERDALDIDTRNALSVAILEEITRLDQYRESRVVLAYVGFGSENQTETFLRHVLDNGKTLLLPKVNQDERRLDLYEVKSLAQDLKSGTWAIREPNPYTCPRAELGSVDLALVPGLAFDIHGGRLGYGGGYYDRMLANYTDPQPLLVAAAFDLQVVDEVPLEEHDVLMDLVFTERGRYTANAPVD